MPSELGSASGGGGSLLIGRPYPGAEDLAVSDSAKAAEIAN